MPKTVTRKQLCLQNIESHIFHLFNGIVVGKIVELNLEEAKCFKGHHNQDGEKEEHVNDTEKQALMDINIKEFRKRTGMMKNNILIGEEKDRRLPFKG